jgi:septal ring factor EnvC (AmiA/AmiB activator)
LFGKKKDNREVSELRDELKVVFSKIKEEFDDHLESINQNTIELQSIFEYLSRLNDKMDKLSSRIDSMESSERKEKKSKEVMTVVLTREEEEVLAMLISNSSKKKLVTYDLIAKNIDITPVYAANIITGLLEKGIPIEKRHLNGTVLLEIDRSFHDRQLQYNIITMD